jgi:hypothetical protein
MSTNEQDANTENRQPDIEIYLSGCSIERIFEWLNTRFDNTVSAPGNEKKQQHITVNNPCGDSIPVLIFQGAVGKHITSVWFQSAKTPWDDDKACARDAFKALQTEGKNVEIRCNAGGWSDEQDPDLWWKINQEGESEFLWKE